MAAQIRVPNSVRRLRNRRRVVGTIKVQAHERCVLSTVSLASQRLVTLWEANRSVRRAVDLMQMCNARLTLEEKGFIADMQARLSSLRRKSAR